MYKMVTTPSASLLKTAEPVDRFDKKLKDVIKEMSATLAATTDPVGVGLAAPQVGISKRIFLVRPEQNSKVQVFINPQILESGSEEVVPSFTNSAKVELKKPAKSRGKLLEGCLSIPNIWGNVARKKKVRLQFQDVEGKIHEQTFTGFSAIIIQHELDHLSGILFTKHVLEQNEQLYHSYKNEKGEDEFEEIEV